MEKYYYYYYTIDDTLTDGNAGARKHRSVQDNIFVISAISNSVIYGDSTAIQAQSMDRKTCFDKLWLQACINSLYKARITNNKLFLLNIENQSAKIAFQVNRHSESGFFLRCQNFTFDNFEQKQR